jgi:hypothetical protein
MAVLEEALLGGASLFPLAFWTVPGSQSDIHSWLAVIFTPARKGKKSSGSGSSCLGYCETSFHRERR